MTRTGAPTGLAYGQPSWWAVRVAAGTILVPLRTMATAARIDDATPRMVMTTATGNAVVSPAAAIRTMPPTTPAPIRGTHTSIGKA